MPFEIGRTKREAADQQTVPLVDLRPVHVVAALEVEPAIADLQIERDRLCLSGKGDRQDRKREAFRDESFHLHRLFLLQQ